ncbi:MAG: ABC transporter permease [Anaerolineae bacterium]|nr:MAG: ABC transporter permease [Anaerolineae bacterium]
MSKLWFVALYEYRRTVFKKSFILALLSVPLMISLNIGVGLLMESLENDNAPVGYIDHAGLLADPIPAPVTGSRKPVEFTPFQTEDGARAALEAKDIQAYYTVAADYAETSQIDLVYLKKPGRNATRQFYDFIQINLLSDQPPDIARRAALISDNVIVRSLDGSRQFPGGGPTFGIIMPLLISIAFVVLLVMSSSYLMQAVADEKENCTMEVLMTSISPTQFIGGKVLGIVAINFTQLVAWAAVTVLGIVVARNAGIAWFQNLNLDWSIIWATLAVAIPSFVLASALMTAIGVAVTSSQEGQSIGALFFILHMIPCYLAWALIKTPNALLPTVLSLLPFTSLLTISLRNIFAAVPTWQVAASVAVQTLCAASALWLAGRAFRLGMLRYGQRLRWRELLKARSR